MPSSHSRTNFLHLCLFTFPDAGFCCKQNGCSIIRFQAKGPVSLNRGLCVAHNKSVTGAYASRELGSIDNESVSSFES